MQKGILVKNGATLVEKAVYAGDISQAVIDAEVARLTVKYPSYTITSYDSDQDAEFVTA